MVATKSIRALQRPQLGWTEWGRDAASKATLHTNAAFSLSATRGTQPARPRSGGGEMGLALVILRLSTRVRLYKIVHEERFTGGLD
jgi:hypothetical protein